MGAGQSPASPGPRWAGRPEKRSRRRHGAVDGDSGGCAVFLDLQTCSKVPNFINAKGASGVGGVAIVRRRSASEVHTGLSHRNLRRRKW